MVTSKCARAAWPDQVLLQSAATAFALHLQQRRNSSHCKRECKSSVLCTRCGQTGRGARQSGPARRRNDSAALVQKHAWFVGLMEANRPSVAAKQLALASQASSFDDVRILISFFWRSMHQCIAAETVDATEQRLKKVQSLCGHARRYSSGQLVQHTMTLSQASSLATCGAALPMRLQHCKARVTSQDEN